MKTAMELGVSDARWFSYLKAERTDIGYDYHRAEKRLDISANKVSSRLSLMK